MGVCRQYDRDKTVRFSPLKETTVDVPEFDSRESVITKLRNSLSPINRPKTCNNDYLLSPNKWGT